MHPAAMDGFPGGLGLGGSWASHGVAMVGDQGSGPERNPNSSSVKVGIPVAFGWFLHHCGLVSIIVQLLTCADKDLAGQSQRRFLTSITISILSRQVQCPLPACPWLGETWKAAP